MDFPVWADIRPGRFSLGIKPAGVNSCGDTAPDVRSKTVSHDDGIFPGKAGNGSKATLKEQGGGFISSYFLGDKNSLKPLTDAGVFQPLALDGGGAVGG